MSRRVVITGVGVITGLGHDVDTFWSGLNEGRSGVGPVDLIDVSEFKVRFAGQVRDFRPDATLHQRVLVVGDDAAIFAVERA